MNNKFFNRRIVFQLRQTATERMLNYFVNTLITSNHFMLLVEPILLLCAGVFRLSDLLKLRSAISTSSDRFNHIYYYRQMSQDPKCADCVMPRAWLPLAISACLTTRMMYRSHLYQLYTMTHYKIYPILRIVKLPYPFTLGFDRAKYTWIRTHTFDDTSSASRHHNTRPANCRILPSSSSPLQSYHPILLRLSPITCGSTSRYFITAICEPVSRTFRVEDVRWAEGLRVYITSLSYGWV